MTNIAFIWIGPCSDTVAVFGCWLRLCVAESDSMCVCVCVCVCVRERERERERERQREIKRDKERCVVV